MDPELLDWLRRANAGRRKGLSDAEIDEQLDENEVGFSYAELVEMAKTQREDPVKPVRKRDVAATFAQGAAFNLLDELMDAMKFAGTPVGSSTPVVPGADEGGAGEAIRESVRRYRAQDPVGAFATEVAGGVAVPGVGVAKLAAKLGGGILARIGATLGVGAVSGGLAGVGAGETARERAALGLGGAAVGGLLGGGLGVGAEVTKGVKGLLGRATDRINPARAGQRAAEEEIRNAAKAVGLTGEDFLRVFNEAQGRRPGLVVPADVTQSFGQTLRSNVNRSAGGFEDAIRNISGRVEDAGERIAQDIQQLSGRGPIAAAREAAEARVTRIGKELFEPFKDMKVSTDELTDLLKNPDVKAVWSKVKPLTGKKEPTVEHFRTLRTRLRGQADASERAGDTALSSHLRRSARELDDILEREIPEFRAANQAYYEANRTIEAFGLGADAYKKALRGGRLSDVIADLRSRAGEQADEALEAFRHGAVDEAINDVLNPRARGSNIGLRQERLVKGGESAGVLREVFESRGQLNEFIERMALENKFTILRNLQVGNSTTIQQGAALARTMQNVQVQGRFAALFKFLAEPDPRVMSEMANIVTDLLTTPGETAAQRVAAVIMKPQHDAFFRAIMALTTGLGVAAGTETQRVQPGIESLLESISGLRSRRDATRTRQ